MEDSGRKEEVVFFRLPSREGWGWVQTGIDQQFVPAEKVPFQAFSPELGIGVEKEAKRKIWTFPGRHTKDDC